MLRHTFEREDAASAIERAVETVIASGLRTPDIHTGGGRPAGTREMSDAICRALASV
jgi:3-isopropylmalate dehydrogenase